MPARVLVINPNSTEAVTDGIRDAVARLGTGEALAPTFATLQGAPPAIETDDQIAAVEPLLHDYVSEHAASFDAIVVACFSDPGVDSLRKVCPQPVVGIGECAYRQGAIAGRRFGVISIVAQSVTRHRRHLERLGLLDALAGDRALAMGVLELADATRTSARLHQLGEQLVNLDGAAAVVLGCAGMASYREALQARLGVTVIDPCQAAIQALLTESTAC